MSSPRSPSTTSYPFSNALGGGPALPTIVGTEGFGRVLAVGRDVENVKVGDRVLAPPLSQTWREKMIVPAFGLFPLPEGDPYQLSMLSSNPPTAALILSEYIQLKPGDWVVQNSANSGVGSSLIAIAKARGLRTINFVRWQELLKELKAAGGDIVLHRPTPRPVPRPRSRSPFERVGYRKSRR